MQSKTRAAWLCALVLAGMVSSLGAVSAWGAAGDNGQFFIVEGLWLTRDDSSAVPMTVDNGFGSTPFFLVTADDVKPGDTGGVRATGQFDALGTRWQASAFVMVPATQDFFVSGLDPSSGSTDTTYDHHAGNEMGTSNSDEFEAVYLKNRSNLWGAEFSWVYGLGGYGMSSVDLLAGVRYLHFSEELTSVVFDEVSDLVTPFLVDRVSIDVDNDLVGVQLGVQGMWQISSGVSIGGVLKGGVAANFLNRDRSFSSDNSAPNSYSDSLSDTNLAEFAEFNPRLDIALSEVASLTVAGTALWINQVSESTTHYESVADIDDANTRDDEDELFYGASVGLKLALN